MNTASTSSFRARFLERSAHFGPLCIGCDPSPELLRQWGLPVTVDGLADFCKKVVSAARDTAAVLKPQIAFFEPFGPQGMVVLQDTIKTARDQGQLVIVDCKRGDIGHSVEAYARAFFGPDSPYPVDAITANAYLGFGTLEPMFRAATAANGMVFVVVRSSNPEGGVVQNAEVAPGLNVAAALARDIADVNGAAVASGVDGPAGAVVGATLTTAEFELLPRLNGALMLVPGVGAQGATFADIAKSFGTHAHLAIPSVSRAFLQAGPDLASLRSRLKSLASEAAAALSTR